MPKSSTAHISTSGVFNVFRDYRSYMEVSKASDYGITAGQEKKTENTKMITKIH